MAGLNNQKNVDIHLKKSTKGALHKEMHVSKGKKISVSALNHEKAIAKKTGNVKLEKRVQFALNARKFKH